MQRAAIVFLALLIAGLSVGCKEDKNAGQITDRNVGDAKRF